MKKIIFVLVVLFSVLNFSYGESSGYNGIPKECQCLDCCSGYGKDIPIIVKGSDNIRYKFPFGGKDYLTQEFGEKNICEKIRGGNYFENECISKQTFEDVQNQNLNDSEKKQIIFENKIDLDLDNFDLFKVWVYLFGLKIFFIILLVCSLIFSVVKFFKFKKTKKL